MLAGITPAWAGKSFSITARGRVRRDHPRVGGEKANFIMAGLGAMGSPPRGRGKGGPGVNIAGKTRITPAWAGKRHKAVLSSGRYGDHPRVGGEKAGLLLPVVSQQGSPPRGRGKDLAKSARWKGAGITPAWAGKRCERQGRTSTGRDHPRVGGEKYIFPDSLTSPVGSPPRGRGKAILRAALWLAGRITPAWAGKSPWLAFFFPLC